MHRSGAVVALIFGIALVLIAARAVAQVGVEIWQCARVEYAAIAVPPSAPDFGPRLWVIDAAVNGAEPSMRSVGLRAQPTSLTCAPDRVYVQYEDGLESRDVRSPDLRAAAEAIRKIPKVVGQHQGRLKTGHLYELPNSDVVLAFMKPTGPHSDRRPEGAVALFALTPKGMRLLFSTYWSIVTVDK